jgi:hypothetical protein
MALLYRITLLCAGIPEASGETAAIDVHAEFAMRQWQRNVRVWWHSGVLYLCAENDYDPEGAALLDEYSDAVVACVDLGENDVSFRVESIVPFEEAVRFDAEAAAWVTA